MPPLDDGPSNEYRARKLGQPAPAAPWSDTDRRLRVAVAVVVVAANLGILAALVPAVSVVMGRSVQGVETIRERVIPPPR